MKFGWGCTPGYGRHLRLLFRSLESLQYPKTKLCGVRGRAEIVDHREGLDVTICTGLLANFFSAVSLFVGIWIVCWIILS